MIETKEKETVAYDIDGVKLIVELDYANGTVSFVDNMGKGERFLFSGGTVDYLGGWIKIFNALEKVTRIADQKIKEQFEIRDGRRKELVESVLVEMNNKATEYGSKKGTKKVYLPKS